MALRALGPTLGAVALVLLVTGIAVAALLIGGPTRRRVRDLDRAARDIGLGRSGVRAAESGGDEVTALARTFNTMAAQLEERAQALEDADRTRRQLLADVSHELSTPLAAIRGYVETLTMPDVQLDEATRTRYLGIVTEEADRLSHIIGDLLDLARLEGGGGQLRVEEVPVALLFERVRHRHAKTATERGVVLDARVDGPETVSGDQNRLEQVLQNLVANALRHTPRGGVVTVRATRTGSGVTLSVRDTGSGIPAEHLPRIFDRFYKADQSRTGKDVPSGSGLGLSIVRAIATRHGGTISAHNADVGGAVFEVFLPSAGGEG
jgi:two-component system sensor histidine kinase BaeS